MNGENTPDKFAGMDTAAVHDELFGSPDELIKADDDAEAARVAEIAEGANLDQEANKITAAMELQERNRAPEGSDPIE